MKKELSISWYKDLITDLKKLEFTGIVLTKWAIGKRILRDFDKFGKPEYGSKKIEGIARDLNVEIRELYRCVQFAEKCHTVTQLKDKSWRFVVNELLPEPRKEKFAPPIPKGKYDVILCDAPWQYNDKHDYNGTTGAETHYPTLSISELCALQIPVADNAIMFFWVTSPLLEECFAVINAWGFSYKTSFVWDKVKHNMGHYNSVRHEFLLVCVRGSKVPEVPKLYDSVITKERSDKHSQKPEIVYEMIETLYPSGKYLELFGRNKREQWVTWGNEL
jgi:N6-adenosine-specific RNA methylase IME4